MSTRPRSEVEPRRSSLSREAKGKSVAASRAAPVASSSSRSISLSTSTSTSTSSSPRSSAPSSPSTATGDGDGDGDDLRWLVDLDLACYSSFACIMFMNFLAIGGLRARLLSLAVAAGGALLAAAAALAPRAYAPRRDLLAAASRVLLAAAINPMMAGGRRFPVAVGSWAQFVTGRTVLFGTLVLGLTSRLPPALGAAVAVAQTLLFHRAQRRACDAVLVGYVGSGAYYVRTQRAIDGLLSASGWLQAAVAVAVERSGSASPGGGGQRAPAAAAAAAAAAAKSSSSLLSSSSALSSSSSSPPSFSFETEARACVAVMTELQVVAALVMVAFGTRFKVEAREGKGGGEEEKDGGGGGGGGGNRGRRRRQAQLPPAPEGLREERELARRRRRRRLSHRRAFFCVLSLGVLRVAWEMLRAGEGGFGFGCSVVVAL